jgi:hypothetical protein
MDKPQWLPDTLHFDGNWEEFITGVYHIFERDFKLSKPKFGTLPVNHDSRIIDGREAGFWHIVQKDDPLANERLPDIGRCEHIPWPKPIIENSSDKTISVWKIEKKKPGSPRQTRVYIWLEDFDYLIALRERPQEMILITAFCVGHESYKRKLRQERDNYLKMQKPPFRAT